MTILVTGGAGYIGSHVSHLLKKQGYDIVIVDDLSNGNLGFVPKDVPVYQIDIGSSSLDIVFRKFKIKAVMHFAGFIQVGESIIKPEKYYYNNVTKTQNLLDIMYIHGVNKIIFSSSAAIFKDTNKLIYEGSEKSPSSVYGRTKLMVEWMLKDYDIAHGLKYVCLRYFNASGASFGIGELHTPETHLIPIILNVASGYKKFLEIYGNDYDTRDGTCVRDYIHVFDLAVAHIKALKWLEFTEKSDYFNLGLGKGYTIKEVVERARVLTGKEIPVKYVKRRKGDPASLVANSEKIKRVLKWTPMFGMDDIISDAWEWHKKL